jgi:hypothetical protein
MTSINSLIKDAKAEVFTRCYIKRRSATDGFYESNWKNISAYVKKYGKISNQLDFTRPFRFAFGNAKLLVDNDQGYFNPHSSESSLWYNFLNQQRTLVKYQAGYVHREKNSSGVWINNEYPGNVEWDESYWDEQNSEWDSENTVFIGLISGDILLGDTNEVNFNLKPLVSVFQEFAATRLTGWTSTGMTASQFVTMVRDQTDGSGNFIFRQFFDNTTSNWDISSTSIVYGNLNTSTAKDVFDKTVWEVMEKLAEAENYVPYISKQGKFKFVSRNVNTSTSAFDFYGDGFFNSTFGKTLKKISSFGFKQSKYYSRVRVKWAEAATTTSYEVVQSSFSVSPSSNPWVLGERTLDIENLLIPTAAVAQTLATALFTDLSAQKDEIDFTTTFIPHLDLLDKITIYHDSSNAYGMNSNWDEHDWADDVIEEDDDLIFAQEGGDAIFINGSEFKFLQMDIDLDNYESRFLARSL